MRGYFDSAEFPEVSTVSKGLALELLQIQRSAAAPWSQYTQWMETMFHSKCVSTNAIRRAVLDLNAKKVKIQKDPARKPEVLQLLHEPFSLPQVVVGQQPHTCPEPVVKKNRTVLQPIVVQEALCKVNKDLASELEQSKAECTKKDEQLIDAHKRISEYNPHNVRRRLQRKDAKIAQQKETIRMLEDVKTAQKVGAKTAQSPVRYLKMKHKQIQEREEERSCEYCGSLEAENTELKKQIIELKNTNAHLLDCIKSHESRKIVTFKDGKYTDDVRLCVMELLSRNVAILQVVRAALKLCKMNCERFPQHTQINEMLIYPISFPSSVSRHTLGVNSILFTQMVHAINTHPFR